MRDFVKDNKSRLHGERSARYILFYFTRRDDHFKYKKRLKGQREWCALIGLEGVTRIEFSQNFDTGPLD